MIPEYSPKVACFKKTKHDFCHKVGKRWSNRLILTKNKINWLFPHNNSFFCYFY